MERPQLIRGFGLTGLEAKSWLEGFSPSRGAKSLKRQKEPSFSKPLFVRKRAFRAKGKAILRGQLSLRGLLFPVSLRENWPNFSLRRQMLPQVRLSTNLGVFVPVWLVLPPGVRVQIFGVFDLCHFALLKSGCANLAQILGPWVCLELADSSHLSGVIRANRFARFARIG